MGTFLSLGLLGTAGKHAQYPGLVQCAQVDRDFASKP